MTLKFKEIELNSYSHKNLNKFISHIQFNKSILVCTLIYNDIRHHNGQNDVDLLGCAS